MSRYVMFEWADECDPSVERRGYCCHCKANVTVEKQDHGIGCFEYWGSKEVHRDWQDTCTVCGGTDIEDERAEEESHADQA